MRHATTASTDLSPRAGVTDRPRCPTSTCRRGTPTELEGRPRSPRAPARRRPDGDTVVVDYVGVRQADGEKFDNSYGTTAPLARDARAGQRHQGLGPGLVGVTKGERLQLDIPADLAYGDSPPDGDVIQKGDALTFVVDVRAVDPGARPPPKQPVAADLPPARRRTARSSSTTWSSAPATTSPPATDRRAS